MATNLPDRTPVLTIFLNDAHDRGWSSNSQKTGAAHIFVEGWHTERREPCAIASYEYPYTRYTAECYYGGDFDQQTWGEQHGFRLEERLLTAHVAEARSKALKIVERKFDKLCESMGRPQTFGQYVIYLAQCLGIKQFCWKRTETLGWHLEDRPENARSYIDEHIRAFHEQYPLEKKAS